MPPFEQPSGYRFGTFDLDLPSGELCKAGRRVRLQEQPLRLLTFLLQRPGTVVTRDELRRELWSEGTFVDFDHGLHNAVNRLREALGDDAETPRFVETVARRGYRFVAPVESYSPPTAVARPLGGVEARPFHLRPRAVLGVLAVGLAAGGLLVAPAARRSPAGIRPMVAVLPFENLGGAAHDEYFADGITEELISRMGRLAPERLGVIARSSAMRYKGSRKGAGEIGAELGVQYLLAGSTRRSGPRVRITAQLIRVSDESQLWSRDYDARLRDVLEIQQEVGRAVASEVGLKLGAGGATVHASARTASPEAYDLVLKGRYELNRRSEEGLRSALERFRLALETEPQHADALAGLADAYLLLGAGDYGVLPAEEAMPRAKDAARQALQVDPGHAEARTTLAFVAYIYDWDWAAADREFRAAVAASPNYATGHHWYALYLKAMGRTEEALGELARAQALDPLSPIIASDRGWSQYQLRDYAGAAASTRQVLDRAPEFAPARWTLGLAELQRGRAEEAIGHLRQAVRLTGENPARLAELGYAYAAAGRRQDAERVLTQLQALSRRRRVSSSDLALVEIGLGRRDAALTLLETAYAERSCVFVNLKLDPRLDSLRDEPRFQRLLTRMAFPAPRPRA
jgi:TolB-like protein/DNA-binding winged helix-turn-helix (wHTH) protein/Flp pilus assembly protein TadD